MLSRVFEILLDLVGLRAYAHHMIGTEFVTHDAYGIPREMFATFFAVVGDTVRYAVGPGWTPAMATGWATLLADVDGLLAAVPDPDVPDVTRDPAEILPLRRGMAFPAH